MQGALMHVALIHRAYMHEALIHIRIVVSNRSYSTIMQPILCHVSPAVSRDQFTALLLVEVLVM